jgi:hypothetical protein
MNEIITEKQFFRQWWILILLGGIDAIILYGLLSQLIIGTPWGDKPLSDTGIIILYICFTFIYPQVIHNRISNIGQIMLVVIYSVKGDTYGFG